LTLVGLRSIDTTAAYLLVQPSKLHFGVESSLLNKGQIDENKIIVNIIEKGGQLHIRMRRSGLIQVFDNLIDNSCFWLGRTSKDVIREINVTIDNDEGIAIVSDNGVGVEADSMHRIFDPFFSTKVDGRGLGLFIAREVLAENGSIIELVPHEEKKEEMLSGATFIIRFANDLISMEE